ncbi:MAG: YiiX/YebB-like N1pC/P60 family cysteine hydrolase [Halomonas sp.]
MSGLQRCGYHLSCWLSAPRRWHRSEDRGDDATLGRLRPGDVLLVEGDSRLSTVIKYLTQSSWSHAALFVGTEAAKCAGAVPGGTFIEADLVEGVRLVGAEEFSGLTLRICRPVGLTEQDIERLIEHALGRIGHRYDLRNILDLGRYLLPLPPVPVAWRRQMLALGSGDPTRAICSTLIAQAFQFIHYPILPLEAGGGGAEPLLKVRHFSLFTPRDFDISPYFEIVKPSLVGGFDPYRLRWASSSDDPLPN